MVSRCHIRELPVMRALKKVTQEKDELLNRSWSRRYFTRTLRHVWGYPLDNVDFFFFKQKTAYELRLSLVGSEMCIRDRTMTRTYLHRSVISMPHSFST